MELNLSPQKQKAIDELIFEVESLVIVDEDSANMAQKLRDKANTEIKYIKDFCADSIKAAHEVHKATKAQEKFLLSPVENVKNILTNKLKEWAQEVRKKEKETQKKLDDMRGVDESSEIIPIKVPSSLQKGWRDEWTWEIEKIDLIPKKYWTLDEKTISAQVRTWKDKTNIPGIKVSRNKIPVSSR